MIIKDFKDFEREQHEKFKEQELNKWLLKSGYFERQENKRTFEKLKIEVLK